MKEAKKIVLKTHPDKSRLDPKFYIFFANAYKKLYSIYEFQNKTTKKEVQRTDTDFYDKNNTVILNELFESNKNLKKPDNFNKWFNEQFESHKLDDTTENGYGDWLKSDDGVVDIKNVTKNNMNSEIERHKKHVQSLTAYKGVSDQTAALFSGTTLMEYGGNFTSGSLFSNDGMGYTDLKQAYEESVIPVTEDDFNNVKKFANINEYKMHRDNNAEKPLSKEDAMKKLYNDNKKQNEESIALAFYYAQQEEKAKQNQDSFWSSLKQLSNW
jgi:hypothetical protein